MDNLKPAYLPVSKENRIKEIDIIRGFALFGVLLVNVVFFGHITLMGYLNGITPLTHPLNISSLPDRISAIFILLFADGKFYTIFSFLFGLGFYIFMKRAEEKELKPKALFSKRMLALFLFGVLNYAFLYYGDILHVYAIGGVILMAFRKRSVKSLMIWVALLLMMTTAISVFIFSYSPAFLDAKYGLVDFITCNDAVKSSFDAYRASSFLEIVKYRMTFELSIIPMNLVFMIPKTLAMFLIGMSFGKLNIFQNIEGNLSFIKRLWKITGMLGGLSVLACLVTGYPLSEALSGLLDPKIYKLSYEAGTVFISLFYISTLLLLLRKNSFRKILSPLQAVGKMALSNYLAQCLICSLVFYGHGMGLIGRTGIFFGVIFTIVFYGLQILYSNLWFRHFKFGPLEWIWRSFTYSRYLKANSQKLTL
ncbi:MAG: DUF418 domain-containing protein [Bacillota bacterium]